MERFGDFHSVKLVGFKKIYVLILRHRFDIIYQLIDKSIRKMFKAIIVLIPFMALFKVNESGGKAFLF